MVQNIITYYIPQNNNVTSGRIYNLYLNKITNLDLSSVITATNLDNQLNCITLSKVDYEKLINLVNKTSELNNQVQTLVKKLERGRKWIKMI